MRAIAAMALVIAALALTPAAPAVADHTNDHVVVKSGSTVFGADVSTSGGAGDSGNTDRGNPAKPASNANPVQPPGSWVLLGPACEIPGSVACSDVLVCDGGERAMTWVYRLDNGTVTNEETRCPGDPPQGAPPPPVTPADAQRAFRQVGIAKSEMQVFPVGGRTLIYTPTVFATQADPFDATVTLLGQQVTFHARAVRFIWHHGDGTEAVTDSPGVPYREGVDPVTLLHHRYQQPAPRVMVSVTAIWDADWDLNGVPQGDVPGEVPVTGPATPLEVRGAQPGLTNSQGG